MPEKMLKPGRELMLRVRQAFLDYGYDGLTMITLARVCEFTRRSLYNYFHDKEDAFRTLIRFDGVDFIRSGLEAGDRVRRKGGSALDTVAEIMDVRYGYARRVLNLSPHNAELNAEAFRRCRDIMIEAAADFQKEIETLLIAFEQEGLLRLRADIAPKQVAQMLTDGARGVNQSLPPIPSRDLARRYRDMCEAILFGCGVVPDRAWSHGTRNA